MIELTRLAACGSGAAAFLVHWGRMLAGLLDWTRAGAVAYATGESFGGLGRGGLIAVIVVSVIAIVTFTWVFRETRKRE